jgi:hypothetical protein
VGEEALFVFTPIQLTTLSVAVPMNDRRLRVYKPAKIQRLLLTCRGLDAWLAKHTAQLNGMLCEASRGFQR